jgi:hypothetical protein
MNNDQHQDATEASLLTNGHSLGENLPGEFKGGSMEWECIEDRHHPGDWRVEAIDHDNEGQIYVAIFSGPEAQERAEEYAALKNRQESREMRIAS